MDQEKDDVSIGKLVQHSERYLCKIHSYDVKKHAGHMNNATLYYIQDIREEH